MKIITQSQINSFQKLLIKAEKLQSIKVIHFEKLFTLDAIGEYESNFMIAGRNCGQEIFVNDKFSCAFKSQTIYNAIAESEKQKFIAYDVRKIMIEIQELETYGKWVDVISPGMSFQAVVKKDWLKDLDLPFSSNKKNWRLGKNWIDFDSPTYLIASLSEEIKNYDIIKN